MDTRGSYQINTIARNKALEKKRLKGQVELFWDKEVRQYRYFGLQDGMVVAEFGCGPGFLTEKILATFPNIKVTAVEMNSEMAQEAFEYIESKGYKGRVKVRQGTIEDSKLESAAYDFSITRLVLEHLPDVEPALREVYRVLKPKGKAVFIDNDFDLHLTTYPPIPDLSQLYDAYCASSFHQGGNPKIGRELPMILKKYGFTSVDFEVLSAHSTVTGADAFFQSEGIGIPTKLVEDGYLSSKVLGKIISQWRTVLKQKDFAICRQLFMACGEKV